MKISVISIAILTIVSSYFLPWWIIAPICFIVSYLKKLKPSSAFLLSFTTVFLIWLGAIFYFDYGTVQIIVGDLLGIHSNLTPLISSAIGGLVAGIFGLSGALFRKKPKQFVNG